MGPDTFMQALRAIEKAAEEKKKISPQVGKWNEKKKRKRSGEPDLSFWKETDSVVSWNGIGICWLSFVLRFVVVRGVLFLLILPVRVMMMKVLQKEKAMCVTSKIRFEGDM